MILVTLGCSKNVIMPNNNIVFSPNNHSGVPDLVLPGDTIEINFYHGLEAITSPYIIAEGDTLRVNIAEEVATNTPFNISEGDILNVDVYEHPELSSSDVLVLPDGHISLPLANRIKASGERVDELDRKLRIIYEQKKIIEPDVTVSIIERRDFSSEMSRSKVLVLPDGYISLPLVNRIEAVGKNIEELEKILTEAYKKKGVHNIHITVAVTETNNNQIASLLPSTSSSTQTNSLVIRVDESGFIDLPYIPLIETMRSFKEIHKDIVKAYEEKFLHGLEVTINLRERQSHFVYVIGEVVSPGSVKFTSPFNPLLAVASAGGFLPTADPSEVRLYRFNNNGGLDYWPINLEERLKKKKPVDIVEAIPQDIIYVPRSGIANANLAIELYIRNMIPVRVGFGLSYPLQ